MKKILVAILLMTSFLAWADAFKDGVAAHSRGDYKTALEKFIPLANIGDADAQFGLGVMFDNGQGVAQDIKQALHWWTLAAERGSANAQYNLGFMYRNGKGVVQDFNQALRWYGIPPNP
jgi:TPR repeat protein